MRVVNEGLLFARQHHLSAKSRCCASSLSARRALLGVEMPRPLIGGGGAALMSARAWQQKSSSGRRLLIGNSAKILMSRRQRLLLRLAASNSILAASNALLRHHRGMWRVARVMKFRRKKWRECRRHCFASRGNVISAYARRPGSTRQANGGTAPSAENP